MVVAGGRDPEADLTLVNALAEYAKHKRLLVVASSDLSHYHGYAEANRLDAVALRSIEALDALALEKDIRAERCEACGILPVLLDDGVRAQAGRAPRACCSSRRTPATPPGRRTRSSATRRSRFYAEAAAGGKQARGARSRAHGTRPAASTRRRARSCSASRGAPSRATVRDGRAARAADRRTRRCRSPQGAFVTITIGGQLRGCIGTFREDQPLYRTVSQMAVAAAQEDPRFPRAHAPPSCRGSASRSRR